MAISGTVPLATSSRPGRIEIASNAEAAAASAGDKALVPANLPSLLSYFGVVVNANETMTGNKTITAAGVYPLDPNAANRDVTLNLSAAGLVIISSTATYSGATTLTIKVGAATIDVLYGSQVGCYVFDGTTYYKGANGSGETGSGKTNTALGASALAYNNGTAVGYTANGANTGVVVGYTANGNTSGAALGAYADGASSGTALGYYTDTNTKANASAIGCYAEAQRIGEVSIGGDHQATPKVTKSEVVWTATQAAENPVNWHEIFLHGTNNARATIRATSSVSFQGRAHFRSVNEAFADYTFEGLIRRNGANSTVLVAVNVTTVRENIAGWDLQFTADDTNESLKVEIKCNDSATSDDTSQVRAMVWATFLEVLD